MKLLSVGVEGGLHLVTLHLVTLHLVTLHLVTHACGLN